MNDIVKKDGKYGVELNSDSKYGLELLVMRNGRQWAGFGLDEKLIGMIQDAFSEYSIKLKEKNIKEEIQKKSKYTCDECKDMGFLFLTPYDYERCHCCEKKERELKKVN